MGQKKTLWTPTLAIVLLTAPMTCNPMWAQQPSAQADSTASDTALEQMAEGSKGKWTLPQCIAHAKEQNLDVRTNQLSVREAQESATQAQGALMPTMSFSTNQSLGWRPWSQSTVALSGGTMTETENDVTYSGSYNLSAQWTVWDGCRTRRQRDQQNLEVERAQNNQSQTETSVVEQVVQYYVQILYETEAVTVADSTLQTSIFLCNRTREMVNTGQMARAELAQMEAQVAQDRYNLVTAQTQLAQRKLQLKQLLELVQQADFDIETPAVNDANVMQPVPSVTDAYTQALSVRPEVMNAQLDAQSAELQERIARTGHYPTISLSAGVSTNHTSASDDGVGSQMKHNVNNSLGLSINVPILDNRQTRTNKAKAKIQVEQSQVAKQRAETEIYAQVETYVLNALQAQTQYVAAQAQEQSMTESFDLVKEQFGVGLKNIAELTQGKENLRQAQQQVLQTRYTALLNIAMLRLYTTGDTDVTL